MTTADFSHAYVHDGPATPALTRFRWVDDLQDRVRPAVWVAEGYWMFTSREAVVDALHSPDLWSSRVILPTEPDPPYRWLPMMIDPPEHTPWRRHLASWFSPARARAMATEHRRIAASVVSAAVSTGANECDFKNDVMREFLARTFTRLLGLPDERVHEVLRWGQLILYAGAETDPDSAILGMETLGKAMSELVEQRRSEHGGGDIVSAAVQWTIDGKQASDADLVNCLQMLFMAALDPVAGQASYAMLHLATHEDDQRRLAARLEDVPGAVEELMRTYPVAQVARCATQDMVFHGCTVRAPARSPSFAAGHTLLSSRSLAFETEPDTAATAESGSRTRTGPNKAPSTSMAASSRDAAMASTVRLSRACGSATPTGPAIRTDETALPARSPRSARREIGNITGTTSGTAAPRSR